MSDTETDLGYRSRSQSRRARRKKQGVSKKEQRRGDAPFNMPSVPEGEPAPWSSMESKPAHNTAKASASQFGPPASRKQAELQQRSNNSITYREASEQRQAEADRLGMQPFEWIGPDQTSMNGPVTYAKAMRGEIPMRPGNPKQKLETGYDPEAGKENSGETGNPLMDKDGLKLRIELNIDIEIELKARLKGDLTLSLMEGA